MDIYNAISHIRQHGCACKHIAQLIERLTYLLEKGIAAANVSFVPHAVILDTGGTQEVLCSRFLEQRD